MPEIKMIDINKVYGKKNQVVFDLSLDIKDKEFVVLVGPSGCGKSTTLRMIAGLEDISSGELFIDDKYMNDVEPKDRNISMVFQSYALFPNMNVKKNIGYGISIRKYKTPVLDKDGKQKMGIDKLSIKEKKNKIRDLLDDKKYVEDIDVKKIDSQIEKLRKEIEELKTVPHPLYCYKKLPKNVVEERVNKAAEVLGLTQYLKSKPRALSGGQQQRVALGRAIAKNCSLFLMDEPLSNLDAKLRNEMRKEIVDIHRKLGATTVYVTHDQIEAMTMADKIVVMKKGVIQQVGTPEEIYDHPVNLFVAGFIGSPTMNFLKGRYENHSFIIGNTMIPLSDSVSEKLEKENEKEMIFGIRPEYVRIFEGEHHGVVTLVEQLGNESTIHFGFENQALVGYLDSDEILSVGQDVTFALNMDYAHFFRISDEKSIL